MAGVAASPDFAQLRAISKHHVIAQSLSKRLWEVSPFTPEHGAPVEPKPGATRFHMNRIIDMVVNVACDDCNSSPTNSTSGSLSEPRTGAAR
jgi:hypothetical protein